MEEEKEGLCVVVVVEEGFEGMVSLGRIRIGCIKDQ